MNDVVIVGGGVNSLVAAGYLARAGLQVVVLERRELLGGVAAGEEFADGARVSAVFDSVRMLPHRIARDLELGRFGLERISVDVGATWLDPAAAPLSLWRDPRRTAKGLTETAPTDAAAYPGFVQQMRRYARVVESAARKIPAELRLDAVRSWAPWLTLGGRMLRLGRRDMTEMLRVLALPLDQLLDESFTSDGLKVLLAAGALIGSDLGPRAIGTSALMLYNGLAGTGGEVWARGGTGALVAALVASARASGAAIRTEAEVESIRMEDGRAIGVVLADGSQVGGRRVMSGLDPVRTLFGLVGARHLGPGLIRELDAMPLRAALTRVDLVLDGPPPFTGIAPSDPRLGGRLVVCRDLTAMERARDDAKYGAVAREPLLSVSVPTAIEGEGGATGRHVLAVSVQFTPSRLRDGEWSDTGPEVVKRTIRRLEEVAPGLAQRVVGHRVRTPEDLESDLGLTAGDVLHGQMTLDRWLNMRPAPELAGYATPISGLWLCGAGGHPGGGLTGLPGHNAARALLGSMR